MRPMSFDFRSRRSMVVARRGMVSSSSPLASQAGVSVLRQGGNAADAAIAAAAVLNVVEPASTGIGGDCFALYYDARTRTISALNGSGRAPAALTLEVVRRAHPDATEMPPHSPHAVTVPGAVRGWEDLLKRHGRMTLRDVLSDAIHYAREGFPVAPVFGTAWQGYGAWLAARPHTQDYLPNGAPPQIGQIVRLSGMAHTLEQIAEGGADAFYQGEPAHAIVAALSAQGGVMTLADLAAHRSTWETPIHTDYRSVTIYECPPNGQGLAALIALNILEGFDLGGLAWDSPERLHLMIEAMRLAFADARHYIADPAFSAAPVSALLSKAYAAQRRALIGAQAMQPPSFGAPLSSSDTVYLCAVDGEGNACSFINSLYMGFGSGIVAGEAGFFLQNRGAGFSLDPEHPNALQPNKRPYHTIIPAMALRNGELWAAFGVMGGFMQPQGHVQVLSAMLDDDLNPQEALDRPRFCLLDGTAESIVALEEGIPVATMSALAELGHPVRPVSGRRRGVFGSGDIIRRDPETGVLFGGCDPRKDGMVAAY
ncbi:MAG: gamma-glutamyltransferase [Candidatus Thermofonsia Clade 1 bacterium]|uniref:Glutathione hydrolase proenzyme n=1 Tax=Candidatus Thermofonsia Clade 1 bacterium TaxID=2364210 RepID=A0A2M8NYY3_9CHLR|nr:MAG: gamma-glutamyltransferase [Candidatus Thermofonsia Clade 1 bacterium]